MLLLTVFIGFKTVRQLTNLEGNDISIYLNKIHNRTSTKPSIKKLALHSICMTAENFNIDGTDKKAIQDLSSRVQYLVISSSTRIQAQSLAFAEPTILC